MGYSPEQQQYSCSTKQCRHAVNRQRHTRGVATYEIDAKTGSQHKHRIARWVTDFKFTSLSYKLRAIPEARCRLHRHKVGDCCDKEAKPTERIIYQVIPFHLFLVLLIILFRVCLHLTLNTNMLLFLFFGSKLHKVGFDKTVYITVHYTTDIARLVIGAVIFHTTVVKHITAYL